MALSPNATPRPSISSPSGSPSLSLAVPPESPTAKRDLANTPASPFANATTGSARQVSSSSGAASPTAASSSRGLPSTLKPIGIVNEQNTCFLNSTFQALSATRPLISLLTTTPTSSLIPSPTLPSPIFPPALIPCLQPSALEPPLYDLLPVTRAFLNNLHKAWKLKDAGGGTYGSHETSAGRFMSLRTLLREIARKYDQYDDYRQQDSHELLRHLLDSMEMEEKDVIKKLQPGQLRPRPRIRGKKGRRDLAGISPLPSPLPSPAHSQPGSPVRQTSFDPMSRAIPLPAEEREIPESEKLVPFVDVLFGGSLASVVVCEKCKSVSHTYEGFLDISLSMKGDEPRTRKRDKIKALFRPKASNATKPNISETINHSNLLSPSSDNEGSDQERPLPTASRDRRRSLDQDDRKSDSGSNLSRNSSLKSLGIKANFSFRRKSKDAGGNSRPGSSGSVSTNSGQPPASDFGGYSMTEKEPSSAVSTTSSVQVPSSPSGSWRHVHGPGPTPPQAAYIQRILAGPAAGAEANDPLAKLRAANNGEGLSVNQSLGAGPPAGGEFGLLDSLKQFTSVEVLEGDNAFACKKCWRIKSGRYAGTEPVLKEEDEDGEGVNGSSPVFGNPRLSLRRATAPSISLNSDRSSEIISSPLAASPMGLGGTDRDTSRSPSTRSGAANPRAPSPLRRQLADPLPSPTTARQAQQVSFSIPPPGSPHHSTTDTVSISSAQTDSASAADGEMGYADDSDGLSDTSESDEEAPKQSDLPVGRPKMPARRKSTHFVLRRAFKRYLIAKAPEVLVFHLKRFKQTTKTGLTFTSFYDLKKVDDFVPFPETLDLAPFLAPNRTDYKLVPTSTGPRAPYMNWASAEHGPELKPVPYRLYAIVVHLGTMIGGHYIAYTLVDPERMFEDGQKVVESMKSLDLDGGGPVRGAENGLHSNHHSGADDGRSRVWCYCSDTSIRLASLDEVLKAKAYLCFYEKVHQ